MGLSINEMAVKIEVIMDVGMDAGELCSVFIRLNLSIARSRLRKDKWLFSARLLAHLPTSCLSALPRSFIAARYERRPSVVIFSGEPWRFSAFFMNVKAAALSRVLVM